MSYVTNKILSKKHSSTIEIEIHLFEDCNLSCSFCCQDHSMKGVEGVTIDEKYLLVERFIAKKRNAWDSFSVNLMGGELFQDQYGDSWFNEYKRFVFKINSLLENKKVVFSFTSNLIFEKTDRVLAFLDGFREHKINITLQTSFDFAGRSWDERQKAVFRDNLDIFSDYIASISVTLHKLSIQSMLKKRDHLFDYCYENFPVNFDWYVPDLKNSNIFHPSDLDCKQALLYLAKYYPESHPIKGYLENETNDIQCCSENRILIAADNSISNCQYLDYNPKSFLGLPNKDTVGEMAERFLSSQGCLSCENLDRCGLYCFVAADFASRQRNTVDCFLKEFYNEVT